MISLACGKAVARYAGFFAARMSSTSLSVKL